MHAVIVKSHVQDGLGSSGSDQASRPIGWVALVVAVYNHDRRSFGFLAQRLRKAVV